MRGHREKRGLALLHGGGDGGGGIGSRSGDTLSTRHPVVGIDRTKRDRVGVLSLGWVGKRTREGQFLCGPGPHHQYGNITTQEVSQALLTPG